MQVESIRTKDFETIKEQIFKLEALRASTTPEEAAVAANKIQDLLFKYELNREDLGQRTVKSKSDDYKKEVFNVGVENYEAKQWKVDLFQAVADNNFCKVLNGSGRHVILVGEDDNTLAVKKMYAYLEYQVRAICRKAFKTDGIMYSYSQTDTINWKNSFKNGAVAIIDERLKAQRKENIEEANNAHKAKLALESGVDLAQLTGTTGSALVISKQADLNEALYRFFPQLRPLTKEQRDQFEAEALARKAEREKQREEDERNGIKRQWKRPRGRPFGSGRSKHIGSAYQIGQEAGKSIPINKALNEGRVALPK